MCQSCVRTGALARATGVELEIAKLQKAVVDLRGLDLQDATVPEPRLELAYEAYSALMTAMNDLAMCTLASKASHSAD